MNNNAFDLKDIQDAAIKYAQENPREAFIAFMVMTAVSKGIADGIARLAPTLKKCWKDTSDKVVALLESRTQPILMVDGDDDSLADYHQDDAIAA